MLKFLKISTVLLYLVFCIDRQWAQVMNKIGIVIFCFLVAGCWCGPTKFGDFNYTGELNTGVKCVWSGKWFIIQAIMCIFAWKSFIHLWIGKLAPKYRGPILTLGDPPFCS